MRTEDQSVVGDASSLWERKRSLSCLNLSIKVASNIQEAACSVAQYTADRLPATSVAGMIQQSSHLEDKIVAVKQEWEATVESLPQLVINLNSDAQVVCTNGAVEAWGCGDVGQARGQHLTEVLKPIPGFLDSTSEFDWANVRKRLAVQELVEWELDQRPLGRALRLSFMAILCNTCRQGNMKVCFAVLVIDDITKLKTAEEKTRKHASEMEGVAREQLAELQKTNESLERELLERRRTKALVERTQERYASLLESKLVGICVVRGGKITYSNTRFSEVFCYSRLELFGKRFVELVHPEDQSTAARMFEKLSKHPSACEGPVSIRAGDKSGRLIWLDMALSLRDKNVESSILVDVVDITAKKEVALSLCDSEKQLRLLSCQLMDSQEMERKRIAAELHDGLGQLMGAIKYKVEEIMMAASNGFRPLRFDQLEEVVNDISGAMDEVRNISMDLRPSTLDDLGVLLTMEWFCREFQNTYSGIKIKKRIAIEESSISEGRKLVIYRIVQEAMNNVAKYANATVIGLELTERLGEIHLCISDNGQGFNMSRVPRESCAHGFGLRSMRERAEISGGIFSIESAVGEGTGIQVFWPERVSSACQLLD